MTRDVLAGFAASGRNFEGTFVYLWTNVPCHIVLMTCNPANSLHSAQSRQSPPCHRVRLRFVPRGESRMDSILPGGGQMGIASPLHSRCNGDAMEMQSLHVILSFRRVLISVMLNQITSLTVAPSEPLLGSRRGIRRPFYQTPRWTHAR